MVSGPDRPVMGMGRPDRHGTRKFNGEVEVFRDFISCRQLSDRGPNVDGTDLFSLTSDTKVGRLGISRYLKCKEMHNFIVEAYQEFF